MRVGEQSRLQPRILTSEPNEGGGAEPPSTPHFNI